MNNHVVVSAYFNFTQNIKREENFKFFLRENKCKKIIVELSNSRKFVSRNDNQTIAIHLNGGSVLWQKERLLNIAIESIKSHVEYVTFLDSDVIFKNNDWQDRILTALEDYKVAQSFEYVYENKPIISGEGEREQPSEARKSIVKCLEDGKVPFSIFSKCGKSLDYGYAPGFAWSFRVDMVKKLGFFDKMILGGGDKALAGAIWGHGASIVEAHNFSPCLAKEYLMWADMIYECCGGAVGYCKNTIEHLPHGDMHKRNYSNRYDLIANHNFSPDKDIKLSKQNVWFWSDENSPVSQAVLNYFISRGD